MKLTKIDFYIIKRFLGAFLLALGLFTVIIIVFDVSEKIDEFIENKAPFYEVIFHYYVNWVPFLLNLFSPVFVFISVIFFTSKMTKSDIEDALVFIRNPDTQFPDTIEIKTQDIEGYMMKGMWYFDKRLGELKYRLLALAPMGKDVLTLGLPDIEDEELYELFWVFYPETRDILHDSKVFNPKNVSQPISYDHLLNARRFNSVIIREENVYGNRKIADYIRGNALFQLLEADRIKESIRNKEIDMWNY